MRVFIRNVANPDDERVIIECVRVTPEIEEIRAFALTKGEGLSGTTDGQQKERIALEDVCYFEAVDEKVFACTADKVYEISGRLYEVEQAYEECGFVRCSKSVVLNLMKLNSISPALNGRFLVHMKNGEKLMISRKYASAVIEKVMGEG